MIMRPRSAYARLLAEPKRFRFDAAARVLARASKKSDLAEHVRFRTMPGLAYPSADIVAVEPPAENYRLQVTTPVMGLTGSAGVLPRPYTDLLTRTLRNRSAALHDFLDMLSHRFVAFFAGAGVKYRINRSAETAVTARPPQPDRITDALLALTGYATPHLVPRLAVGPNPLLHYAGLFSGRPRSAEKLGALVSDWLGREVEVSQFVGAWLFLATDQQTALAAGLRPGAWNRLGVDAAIGVRAWDLQSRIVLRVGPLNRSEFEGLLPDRSALQRLVSLVRAFLGFEISFAINPVLAGPEVPPLLLDARADAPPRLGWNSWIPDPEGPPTGGRRADAADAIFPAEIIEAEAAAGRGGL